ncbi:MAG: hypothetical protein AUJ98_07365 [Bacteroidetes bacterium CG2_30_33_31]|nr:MAG: hypothetical protein AUJ98_07365 [Bacteroidetes bacterium CG2_30_33_31]
MIKNKILLFFLFFGTMCQAQTSHFLYYKLNGCASKKAILYNVRGESSVGIDTAYLQQSGGFAFSNIEKYPAGMYVVSFNDSVYTEVILNDEDIVLEANIENILMTMEVRKSVENQILFGYWQYAIMIKDSVNKYNLTRQKILQATYGNENKQSLKLYEDINRLNDKLYDFIDEEKKLHPESFAPKLLLSYQIPSYRRYLAGNGNLPYDSEKEYYWNHFLDNVDFSDPRLLNSKVVYVTISDFITNFGGPATTKNYNNIISKVMALANSNEEVYQYCLNLFIKNFDNTIWEDVFVYLIDNYYTNSFNLNESIRKYYVNKSTIIKNLKPGKKAPSIILPDSAGNLVDLYNIKAKAKMIIFYSSDCPHCEEAMPDLKKIYNDYKNSGLEVIGVAIDDEASMWKNNIIKDSLTWISVSDLKGMSSPIVNSYNIWMTPTIYILDKKDIIMSKPKGPAEIQAALLQVLY